MTTLPFQPDVRHEFLILIATVDCTLNACPDSGSARVDPETNHGLVTPGCIKRAARDYVHMAKEGQPGFEIYLQKSRPINRVMREIYENHPDLPDKGGEKNTPKQKSMGTKEMLKKFHDFKMFGGVLNTGVHKCQSARGPIQVHTGRTCDVIHPMEQTITRVCVTKETDDKETEMGTTSRVPFGLYRIRGYYNASDGLKAGVTEKDLRVFYESIEHCWSHNRSTQRSGVEMRGLYVFSHDSVLGNGHAHDIFNRVKVEKVEGVEVPRDFSDYTVTIKEMPKGVTCTTLYASEA